jgi:hypothetical protein
METVVVIVACFYLAFSPATGDPTSHQILMDGEVVMDVTGDMARVCLPGGDLEPHEFRVRAVRGDESVDSLPQEIRYAVNTDLDGNGKTYYPDFIIFGAAFETCNTTVQRVPCPE